MLKEICPECKGNGFITVPYSLTKEETHAQCPTCNSQGEIEKSYGSWIINSKEIDGGGSLLEKIENLEKQKKILQSSCKRAGEEIKELKDTIQKLEKHFMKKSLL
jgi:chaperonin cofactor prefoldin|tara:strand:+ start:1658 stop:1972 length:315 start_codon:yes stop_codon:yes gene_type:complete